MAVRSFQQILDAHESAQAMLRSLEIDVRDTLNQARVELARYQVAPVSSDVASTEWKAGDRFELIDKPGLISDVSVGGAYQLVANKLTNETKYPLSFYDDKGDARVFYSFWQKLIRKV